MQNTRILLSLLILLAFSLASGEEFDPNSHWEIGSEVPKQFTSRGHHFVLGPQLAFIQSEVEPKLLLSYSYDFSSLWALEGSFQFWLTQPDNFNLTIGTIRGEVSNTMGAFGVRAHLFHEDLLSTELHQEYDMAASAVYINELIPWSEFPLRPRFEAEIGYRQNPFLREGFAGSYKTSHAWVSFTLAVSLFTAIGS